MKTTSFFKILLRAAFPLLLTLLCLFKTVTAGAQKTDSLKVPEKTNIFHYAMRMIRKNSADSLNNEGLLTTRGEAAFIPYEGKTIRHIFINRYGFDQSFTDTANRIKYGGTKVLNRLHRVTREWAIRNNLFIKPNTPLLAFRLADNERYLRSLDYIRDARILVKPVLDTVTEAYPFNAALYAELASLNVDSVDIYIVTKDLFSITGELGSLTTEKLKLRFSEGNFLGMAQKIQVSALAETNRMPASGAGATYTKYNIAGTFIDASAGATFINRNLYDQSTDEHAYFISLQRPLISQFTHLAGGISAGHYQTYNDYNKSSRFFYDYAYNNFDAWLGYNTGVEKFIKDRNRKAKQVVSMRYFNTNFTRTPLQVGDSLNFRFNDKQAVLGQVTFFKQQFYKTNYLLGFGTTEDIPYGYNVALTTGWYRQSFLNRAYAGVDANKYVITGRADIIQYFLRAGTFLYRKELQDASILGGLSGYSRLILLNKLKMRQYFLVSYARQFNRVGREPLNLSNPFGVRYFNADSTFGYQRLSLHSETIAFINYRLFGFKFSPFIFGDIAMITPENEHFIKSGTYYGIGGGVRVRNENLIFGTTELRMAYFPRRTKSTNMFEGTLRINIAFKYNSNYVRKPEIIQLNSDYQNDVY